MASALDTYNKSAAAKTAQSYQNSTISDIGKRYGMDFSKTSATTQAETEAQAQRNAQQAASRTNNSLHTANTARITNDYRSGASSLDKGYFQKYLGTAQNQANRGLNGGMAAAQNLQLAMNQQGELADLWRTRNMASQEESMRFGDTSQTIAEALSQIEKEKSVNSNKYYQDLLNRAYEVLSSDRAYGSQLDSNGWSKYMASLNYALDQQKLADARAAAARSGSPGGSPSSKKKTTGNPSSKAGTPAGGLGPKYKDYSKAKSNQSQTALDKYNNSPSVKAVNAAKKKSPMLNYVFPAPSSINNNQNMNAWEKMKMMGVL